MNHANFRKLVALERRRTAAVAMLDQMKGSWVASIKLAGTYGEIDNPAVCHFVTHVLRRHLEDEIDTLTKAMHELGVDAPVGAEDAA